MDDFVAKQEEKIKEADKLIGQLKKELADYVADVNNNVFASLEEAEEELFNRYKDISARACGDGVCGKSRYTQDFTVNGVVYTVTFGVEYDRFDKRFYVVDSFDVLSIKEKINE